MACRSCGSGRERRRGTVHSLEDETGIANLFVPKTTFHRLQRVITGEAFLLVKGRLQISEGDQPTVFVNAVEPLPNIDRNLGAASHDFN